MCTITNQFQKSWVAVSKVNKKKKQNAIPITLNQLCLQWLFLPQKRKESGLCSQPELSALDDHINGAKSRKK